MKRLLLTAFIITSLAGFSQEKKGICSASVQLFHDNGEVNSSNDHFYLEGFSFNNPLYYGNFQVDSTALSDSLIYEITLPFGDSLLYSAGWIADGMCFGVDTAVVNHLVTVLEGIPFPIAYAGYYSPGYFNLSQTGVITSECFFRIRKDHTYFIRVKFQDPPIPETPLDLPEITNEISMWLSGENTLSVKTDQDAVWDLNLYSLSGQMLQKKTMEGSQDLDISNLPKGCYIARVSGENGLEKQLRFIK
ncbi:T9SS type A sorting domain-containing protein [Fluviicola taffensis]|uniref:T9SS type A sorting domain-containing protein n=1 Tax=Fluviicola taffensis TaxID=191579 RepID=UPI0031377FB3